MRYSALSPATRSTASATPVAGAFEPLTATEGRMSNPDADVKFSGAAPSLTVTAAVCVPAFGGFCAYGVALGKKFDGDPNFWKIVNGRLYLNLDGDIQAEWAKDTAGNITKADGNWGRIRATAVDKL